MELFFHSNDMGNELINYLSNGRIYGVFFLSVMDGLVCVFPLWFEQGLPQEMGKLQQL